MYVFVCDYSHAQQVFSPACFFFSLANFRVAINIFDASRARVYFAVDCLQNPIVAYYPLMMARDGPRGPT